MTTARHPTSSHVGFLGLGRSVKVDEVATQCEVNHWRAGIAHDGVTSSVDMVRSSIRCVSIHCFGGSSDSWGSRRAPAMPDVSGNPTEPRDCVTWRCTLNRCLAVCAPRGSARLLVKGQRGCFVITVALRLDHQRYRVHAAEGRQVPCVPGPRSRGAIVLAVGR